MSDGFEPIILTPEQEALSGPAKAELYKHNYLECIKRMKSAGQKFPADARSDLGIDVTMFAKWCGFKRRQTVYDNAFVKKRIAHDVKKIGIESQGARTVTEEKSETLIAKQSKEINEQLSRVSELSNRVDVLTEQIAEQKQEVKRLEAELASKESDVESKAQVHKERVLNSIEFGGRSFDY